MRRVAHRPGSETHWRLATDAAVTPPAATRNRTIATCCDAVARQTQAKPPPSPLRPPKTKCPNTHSDRGAATHRPPAGSFPAGFRTPAPVPVTSFARAGIRNPQQNATWRCARVESALAPTPDIGACDGHVAVGPGSDICTAAKPSFIRSPGRLGKVGTAAA